jgi:putative endonuclease
MHFVYILYSKTLNKFYVGESALVLTTIDQHLSKYFENPVSFVALDWEVYYKLECIDKIQALKIEQHLRKMKGFDYFENLVRNPDSAEKLLSQFF